jgi:hypothetical protein
MSRYGLAVGAAALALFVAPGGAMATSLLYQDLSALTQSSDAVVHGTVKKTESRWSGDHQRIVTEVSIDVSEFLKGKGARTVVVLQPGGEVGGIGQKISGLASFAEGEEVVLFLEHKGAEKYRVAGMALGKYRVERSSDKTAAFAVPESTGDAMVIDPQTREPVQVDRQPMDLTALKAKVRVAAKAHPGGAQRKKSP